jgi:hypothetical protein
VVPAGLVAVDTGRAADASAKRAMNCRAPDALTKTATVSTNISATRNVTTAHGGLRLAVQTILGMPIDVTRSAA